MHRDRLGDRRALFHRERADTLCHDRTSGDRVDADPAIGVVECTAVGEPNHSVFGGDVTEEDAAEVDTDDAVELGRVQIRERHGRVTAARVVYRGVKAAELLHRPLNEALDRGSVVDIGGNNERPTTLSLDCLRHPNERLLIARREHDRCSPIGEHPCGGRTDPPACPGDDRDLSLERTTLPSRPLWILSAHVLLLPLS